MTGEFLSTEPGRSREDGRQPYLVKMLVRDQTMILEYWDEPAAGPLVKAAQRGDILTLPAYPRAYKDRIYWRGVGSGASK